MIIRNTAIKREDVEDKNVLVLTGAGISFDSGIPTYTGKSGAYKKIEDDCGKSIEELLSANSFKQDPSIVWSIIFNQWKEVRNAVPNHAHNALAKIESYAKKVMIGTQNVDGLHQKANSTNVSEIHGNLAKSRCVKCLGFSTLHFKQMLKGVAVPECEKCGGTLKPNVTLFHEMPNEDALDNLQDFASEADIMFVVGTKAYFAYIWNIICRAANTKTKIYWVDVERIDQFTLDCGNSSFRSRVISYTDGATSFFSEIECD